MGKMSSINSKAEQKSELPAETLLAVYCDSELDRQICQPK